MTPDKKGLRDVLSELGGDALAHFKNIGDKGLKDPSLGTNFDHVTDAFGTFLAKREKSELPDSELVCAKEGSPPIEEIARSIAIRKALAFAFPGQGRRVYCDYLKPLMETDDRLNQSLLESQTEVEFTAAVEAIITKDVRTRMASIR